MTCSQMLAIFAQHPDLRTCRSFLRLIRRRAIA
jgi:hypothetical protein